MAGIPIPWIPQSIIDAERIRKEAEEWANAQREQLTAEWTRLWRDDFDNLVGRYTSYRPSAPLIQAGGPLGAVVDVAAQALRLPPAERERAREERRRFGREYLAEREQAAANLPDVTDYAGRVWKQVEEQAAQTGRQQLAMSKAQQEAMRRGEYLGAAGIGIVAGEQAHIAGVQMAQAPFMVGQEAVAAPARGVAGKIMEATGTTPTKPPPGVKTWPGEATWQERASPVAQVGLELGVGVALPWHGLPTNFPAPGATIRAAGGAGRDWNAVKAALREKYAGEPPDPVTGAPAWQREFDQLWSADLRAEVAAKEAEAAAPTLGAARAGAPGEQERLFGPAEMRPEFPGRPRAGEALGAEDLLGGQQFEDDVARARFERQQEIESGQQDMFGAAAAPEVQPVNTYIRERMALRGTHSPMRVEDLNIDPERFQYKVVRGATGETGSLAGVKKWSRELEGEVGVWIDPATGDAWVVDGHNRVGRAKQLGVETLQNVYYIPVDTAEEARAVGALRNIASGRGTAVDAAKFFRDSKLTAEQLDELGLSFRERMVTDGLALSRLADSLFGQVARGEMPIERGIVIGQRLPDPTLQVKLVQMLDAQAAKGRRVTNDVVAELADMVSDAPRVTATQASLFGDLEAVESLAVERAEVLAYVKSQLVRDRRLFGTVARHGVELERGGNVIDEATSKAISTEAAQLLELFDRTKNRAGSINGIVNDAARRIAAGENPVQVKEGTYARIAEALPAAIRGERAPGAPGVAGVRAAARPGGAVPAVPGERPAEAAAERTPEALERERILRAGRGEPEWTPGRPGVEPLPEPLLTPSGETPRRGPAPETGVPGAPASRVPAVRGPAGVQPPGQPGPLAPGAAAGPPGPALPPTRGAPPPPPTGLAPTTPGGAPPGPGLPPPPANYPFAQGRNANRKLLWMFSHPSKPGPEYTVGQRATKLWRDFVRAWFDSKADLAAVQRLGQEAKGAPLAPDEMAYELSRLNPHMAARVRVDEQLKPAIQLVGKDQPYLSVYLTHMHNVDIADALGNEARMFSGGLTAEDARAGIDDLRVALGRQRFERVQQAAQQVWDFGDDMRRRLYESGAISESLYNELGRKYPHWVKTTILDYLRDPQRVPPGQKVGLNDPGLRRLTVEGTVRDREDPLASMVRVAYQTESVARRNQVFSALVRLTEGSPDLRQVVRQVETGYSPTRNELTVRGFVDGERRTYAMPSDLANAVEFESQAAIPVITPLMSLFRALATARNPLFLSANAFRDAASYTIRASMREGGPQHLPRVIYALGQAYGDAFKGLRTGEYKGAATARYLREGGGQFGFFQPGQQEAAAELARLSRSSVFQVNSKADLLRIAKDIAKAEPVMAVGERIELAPRVAQMGLAERRGANVVEAVIEGRSVTLDFSQGGTFARFLNQFVPFFNVGLQGLAQPFRAAKEHPLGFVTTGFTLLAGGTVAAEAWNRSDPQRARDYDDVPSYIKDQGVVLMWPGEAPVDAQGNRHPQFVLIRVSEYAPITIATREAVSRALGDDPRTWASLIGGTAQAVSPVQGTNAADLISSVNPFLLNTALQVALDRDLFRDRKIATEWADEQASTASNALARALGVRPSQVEFAIRDLAGGPGAMALEASDVLAGRQQERAAGPQAVPIIGQAIGRVVKGTIGGRLEREQERLLTRESRQVIAEMDVRYAPQPVRGEIKGIPLRLEERERLQRLTNQYVNEAIAGLGGLGDWGEVPSDARQRILERAIAGARAQAANEVLASVNDIATRKARAR